MTSDSLLRVRVARKSAHTADICSLELVAADGGVLPAYTAGAHVDVHLPNGLVRPYSLCGDPYEAVRYELGVLHDAASRGGSRAVHDTIAEGDTLQIGSPRNHFELAAAAPHHLLMAGGIGVTPLLAMAETLHRRGASFTLHLATRSRERTPFRQRLAEAPWAANVHLHHDDDPATALDIAASLRAAPAHSHLYVCGPRGFMDAVLGSARAAGWPEARLHAEFFGAAAVVPSAGDGSFEIELARSGRIIVVDADRTVAQALDAANVMLATSCEQGVCGTCLTRVIAGIPDHRDQYLTPEEQAANDQFLPCCSRSKSARLVIDL